MVCLFLARTAVTLVACPVWPIAAASHYRHICGILSVLAKKKAVAPKRAPPVEVEVIGSGQGLLEELQNVLLC